MHYSISEINKIVSGKTLSGIKEAMIAHVSVDTRQLTFPQHTLFFCLTARSDGHQYIPAAYQKGIRNFIISKNIATEEYGDANFILVDDTLKALQQFGKFHREQFKIPVIGITGSNGKTIVKEWLYQLLSAEKNIVKSPKSYNSQLGVPLSVLNMEEKNELAIFEAGISTVNEMQNLEQIIQPTIGIFTNIGGAHDAGFESREQKVKEKLLLFKNAATIIYCSDYEEIEKELNGKSNCISWSLKKNATINVSVSEMGKSNCTVTLNSAKFNISHSALTIPFADTASIENCIHCIAILLLFKYPVEKIQEKIHALRNLPMRLELKYGINNCTIIDDSYSADFHSLQIALNFLNQQETHKKKTLIISAFEETGLSDKDYILRLKNILQQNAFDKLIGVGKVFMQQIESLAYNVKEWYVFESTEKLLEQFHVLKFENELILLKGARSFGFEKITAQLIGQTHATVFEINLNALTNNLNVYKSYLGKDCGIIAMVKAFSYGSGSVEVAGLLENQRVSYLAVAYADEGIHLRKNKIATPIMVLNPDAVDFDRMMDNDLEPEIYSLQILRELIEKASGRHINIHLKIETGMNRLGFVENDIDELNTELSKHKNITIKTIFSHLAGSEDAHLDEFTNQQISTFNSLSEKITSNLNYSVKKHLLNSSGILRFPQAHYDYVRLGIGLYGVDSTSSIQQQLQTIGTLKTRISQIKHVQKGETIGYSRKGLAEKNIKIAVLAIGYADGYDRRFGNGVGEVFIAGQRAKIVGNICMDMCMADITHIDETHEGDEAEIYGKEISIIEQAEKIDTISYELLTRISSRVKRLYFLD
ncbi:MAG: Alanine racemase [Bacteroidota bacterium]|nr:Alanine racemase [Bacteroidota bacterium]